MHPGLLVHTALVGGQRRLVAQASASRPPLIFKDPKGLTALAVLPDEFDPELAGRAWGSAGIPEDAHDGLWSAFEAAGLFSGVPERNPEWWEEWGWREARAYHEGTRDYPFLQMDRPQAFRTDASRMAAYASESPPPPIYQRFAGGRATRLTRLAAGESPDEWLARVEQASESERLGVLLQVCFGERGRIAVADGSTCLLKNIPSGGARHPTEIFLAIFDLAGLPAGVYHYNVERHCLDEISSGDHASAFAQATLDLFIKLDAPPRAVLVFTSLVERAMWRYRDPRSFRAILVDVGHAVSAYRRVARLLGYRTYAYQKMDDEKVAALLGIDRFRQPPLYVATLVP